MLTIVVSGPQATGKTTLAMALGSAMGIPVFSRDPLMQALDRAGRPWPPGPVGARGWPQAADRAAGAAARTRPVGDPGVHRAARRAPGVAAHVGHGGRPFRLDECTCRDAGEHHARFQQRHPAGRRARGWRYATATIRRYQPDPEADFVADAMRPAADLVADVMAIAGDGPALR